MARFVQPTPIKLPNGVTIYQMPDGLIFTAKDKYGNYYDNEGTKYSRILFEAPRVGVAGFYESSPDDSYTDLAEIHDPAFDRARQGYELPGESAGSVALDFIAGCGEHAFDGAKKVVSGLTDIVKAPVYALLGGVGGFFRYKWIEKKRKDKSLNG